MCTEEFLETCWIPARKSCIDVAGFNFPQLLISVFVFMEQEQEHQAVNTA
jgi:hypothetical protein